MTKLVSDTINNILSFIVNDYNIWEPAIDYSYKIKMKINMNSILIQNLEAMLLYKLYNPITKQIIQIYSDEGGRKTIEAYTFKIVIEGFHDDDKEKYYNSLIKYSFYYENIIHVNNEIIHKHPVVNYIIIYVNNDKNEEIASLDYYDGYGAVIDGYHYFHKTEQNIIKKKLNSSYVGFFSAYRMFPTIKYAKIYEFDDIYN
jgi:hypothetical protein